MLEVTLERRAAYGAERIYPVGEGADELTALLRRKTLDARDVELL